MRPVTKKKAPAGSFLAVTEPAYFGASMVAGLFQLE